MFFDDSLRQSLIGLVVVLNSISFFSYGLGQVTITRKGCSTYPREFIYDPVCLGWSGWSVDWYVYVSAQNKNMVFLSRSKPNSAPTHRAFVDIPEI